MRKIVLVFGLISGIIVSVLMYMMLPAQGEKMNFDRGMITGYITMIIALSTIFFGVKNYRDKVNAGHVNFGKAFLIGLYISLIASAFYVVTWELYFRTAGSSFMADYTQYTLGKMKSNGSSDAEVLKEAKEMKTMWEAYQNPGVRYFMTAFEILPVGIVVSLICAAILKRPKRKGNQVV